MRIEILMQNLAQESPNSRFRASTTQNENMTALAKNNWRLFHTFSRKSLTKFFFMNRSIGLQKKYVFSTFTLGFIV